MATSFKLFTDEQEAFNKMKSSGLSDDQAFDLIKKRRWDLGISEIADPVKAAALSQMQNAWKRADEAAKTINSAENFAKTSQESSGIVPTIENFVKGAYQKTKSGLESSAQWIVWGIKRIGEGASQVGQMDSPLWVSEWINTMVSGGMRALSSGIGWVLSIPGWVIWQTIETVTPDSLKSEIAKIAAPIAQKYESLPEDQKEKLKDIWAGLSILTSALGGKMAEKWITWSLKGGVTRKMTWGGTRLTEDAVQSAEQTAKQSLENAAEWVYKDGTKLFIPKQEWGIAEGAKSLLRKTYGITEDASDETMTRLANRGLMTNSMGKSEWEIVKRPEAVKDGLEALWKGVRSWEIEWSIDNMVNTAKATMSGLDKYGKIIGDAVDKTKDAAVEVGHLGNIAEDVLKNSTRTAAKAPWFSFLQTVQDDLSDGALTMAKASEIKSEIGSQLAALKQSGNAGTKAYKALSDIYGWLGTATDNVIDSIAGNLPELKAARDMYRKLKTVSLPLAKSLQVEMRQAPASLPEMFAMIQHLDPTELILNPVGGLKQLGMKTFSEAVKDLNSRAWNLGNFFRILDQRALSGKWEGGIKETAEWAAEMASKMPDVAPPGSLVWGLKPTISEFSQKSPAPAWTLLRDSMVEWPKIVDSAKKTIEGVLGEAKKKKSTQWLNKFGYSSSDIGE